MIMFAVISDRFGHLMRTANTADSSADRKWQQENDG